jgi:hypothetical protein
MSNGRRPFLSANVPDGTFNTSLASANALRHAPTSEKLAPNSVANAGSAGATHAWQDINTPLVTQTALAPGGSRSKVRKPKPSRLDDDEGSPSSSSLPVWPRRTPFVRSETRVSGATPTGSSTRRADDEAFAADAADSARAAEDDDARARAAPA